MALFFDQGHNRDIFRSEPLDQTKLLENSIHPLFHRLNFLSTDSEELYQSWEDFGERETWKFLHAQEQSVCIESELYERLKPALVLASRMIEKSHPYFHQILFAEIVAEEIQHVRLRRGFKYKKVREVLEMLANRFLIVWHRPGNDLHGRNEWGVDYMASKLVTFTSLGSAYRDHLMGPLYHLDSSFTQATLFCIAITLVHETSHAMWKCRHLQEMEEKCKQVFDQYGREIEDDVYSSEMDAVFELADEETNYLPITGHRHTEYGWAWEHWMFGGYLHRVDYVVQGLLPCIGMLWTSNDVYCSSYQEKAIDAEADIFSVPASTIRSMFYEEFWRNPRPQLVVTSRAIVDRVDAKGPREDAIFDVRVEHVTRHATLDRLEDFFANLSCFSDGRLPKSGYVRNRIEASKLWILDAKLPGGLGSHLSALDEFLLWERMVEECIAMDLTAKLPYPTDFEVAWKDWHTVKAGGFVRHQGRYFNKIKEVPLALPLITPRPRRV